MEKRKGIQRYICSNCGKTFSSSKRPNRLQEAIFQDYFNHRYTLSQLSKKYGHSRQWIQKKIHTFSPNIAHREARSVTAVIDATFFGRRSDKFGLIVVKDIKHTDPIAYNFIQTETKEVYRDLIQQINFKGHKLQAVSWTESPVYSACLRIYRYRCATFICKRSSHGSLPKNPE